jgi:thiamine-phosphate pyrophosphorylase
MASRCQLYLTMPASFAGDVALVESALAAAGAPSLLVVGEGPPERLRAIVAAAHRQNATVVTDTPALLANVQGFDGLHLPNVQGLDGLHLTNDVEQIQHARGLVGADGIVGADSALSRHEALTLGEAGADYVAFGRGKSLNELVEMVDWWSALVEIPCAAYAPADAGETAWRMLAAAGADFIIPALDIWDRPEALQEILERLAFYCRTEEVQTHL